MNPNYTSEKPAPLYCKRNVLNADEIHAWARSCGLENVVAPEDLHVTVCYSEAPVLWANVSQDFTKVTISEKTPRYLKILGADNDCLALIVESSYLKHRWKQTRSEGCSWNYGTYHPHITIAKPFFGDVDGIPCFTGKIVLGYEIFEDIK
jgi:hypothetical protein